jgi:hypothetical protein
MLGSFVGARATIASNRSERYAHRVASSETYLVHREKVVSLVERLQVFLDNTSPHGK